MDGVYDVRDESDREGLRVVVEVKQGASPEVGRRREGALCAGRRVRGGRGKAGGGNVKGGVRGEGGDGIRGAGGDGIRGSGGKGIWGQGGAELGGQGGMELGGQGGMEPGCGVCEGVSVGGAKPVAPSCPRPTHNHHASPPLT